MTAFHPDVIIDRSRSGTGVVSAVARIRQGIAGWRAARRRRAAERAEILRLRKLEPYLLKDAGIDAGPLFAAVAHIAAAHEMLFFPNSPRRQVEERPQDW